ncbi:hypothetical protein HAX54_033913 [Datura stramonium]|uniref:Uncharacterized protein n=1 Tax=Datura stramonium TaxID=4076 RepID=A0ABS8SDX5_DATST|nr:hypothetical protein [Datura stramonium]
MLARVGGASSSSAPRVEGHVTRATIDSESMTLIITPPATEAATPDPSSVTTALMPLLTALGPLYHRQLCQTLKYSASQVYPISRIYS